MTNPFAQKPAQNQAPAAVAPAGFGGNPFAMLGTAEENTPLLPPGVAAQVLINAFRIVPAQIGSQVGDAVYIDFTIEKLYTKDASNPKSMKVVEGEQASHRISGFTGTGAKYAAIELKSLFLCALAGDGFKADSLNSQNPDPALAAQETAQAWAAFPMQVQSQGLLNGKRIAIQTEAKGKTNKKTVASFMPVA